MAKRVWILGAGASKDMGYPLGVEVLKDIEQKITTGTSEKGVYQLWEHIKQSFGIVYGNRLLEEIDFEEYLSRLWVVYTSDIKIGIENVFSQDAELKSFYFNDKQLTSSGAALALVEMFLRIFYWYWMSLRDELHEKIKQGEITSSPILDFCKSLNPSNDIIISFNQDLLLEYHLKGKSSGWQTNFPANIPYSYAPKQVDDTNFLSILKPHGSANWMRRRKTEAQEDPGNYKRIIEYPDSEYALYEIEKMLNEDFKELKFTLPFYCFMVLPSIFKGITEEKIYGAEAKVFFELYDVSLKQLQQADQIVIAGFSCRPTDHLASALLNLGLRGKAADQVLVIDPSEKVPEGISRNIDKFNYIRRTFHEWIDDKDSGMMAMLRS